MTRLRSLCLATLLLLSTACAQEPIRDPSGDRALPAPVVPPLPEGAPCERFLAFGDMGTGRPDQVRVADAMRARAAELGLDFALTLGDNFYPAGVLSADDPLWRTHFEEPYAGLDVPFYASLGNHDHRGNAQAQLDYSARGGRWRMPGRYYAQLRALPDGTTLHLFAIDTTPLCEQRDPEQLAWLDRELAASTARWKVVFGHHPVYSHGPHGHTAQLVRDLQPLLARHHVDLYLAGHDHTLEVLRPVDGVHHVVSGAAGGRDMAYRIRWTEESLFAATLGGFVLGRVSREALVLELVRVDARTQFVQVIAKE